MATAATRVTDEEAATYFGTRLNSTAYTGGTDAEKENSLKTAEDQLLSLYDVPAVATADQKQAIFEQAILLLQQGSAFDDRLAVQVQGVKVAGVVKETYKDGAGDLPVAPMAKSLLEDVKKTATAAAFAAFAPVARDQESSIDDAVDEDA